MRKNSHEKLLEEFYDRDITILNYTGTDSISTDMAACLWMINDAKPLIFVIGNTGAGKTTLMNSLCMISDQRDKKDVIEYVRELDLRHPVTYHTMSAEPNEDDLMMEELKNLHGVNSHTIIVSEAFSPESVLEIFKLSIFGHKVISGFHEDEAKSFVKRINTQHKIDKRLIVNMGILCVEKGDRAYKRNITYSEVDGDGNLRNLYRSGDIITFESMLEKSTILNNYINDKSLGKEGAIFDLEERKQFLLECSKRMPSKIEDVESILMNYYC